MEDDFPKHLETPAEEKASSLTHALGAILSALGLFCLVLISAPTRDPRRIASSIVFGLCLLLLYGASACYHRCRTDSARHVMKILDHSAIFLLIAGTYTPFALITLRHGPGWKLFTIVWSLAVLGITLKLFFVHKWEPLSVAIYVAMGWLVVFFAAPIFHNLSTPGLIWLGAGGAAYTLGVIFFFWDRLPFNHSIWHLFVLAGSICHFIAVIGHVMPMPPA